MSAWGSCKARTLYRALLAGHSSDPATKILRLRILCILLGIILAWSLYQWYRLKQLASYSLDTHYNLYYLDWKAGKRDYEPSVALAGMFHDIEFRKSLRGMTVAQFEFKFQSTFFEIKYPDKNPDRSQRIFITSYEDAQKGDTSYGWRAVFENDRLIELDYWKG